MTEFDSVGNINGGHLQMDGGQQGTLRGLHRDPEFAPMMGDAIF